MADASTSTATTTTSTTESTPLTPTLLRTLTDKLYEKRKAAALEIEKQVRELVRTNNYAELDKLIGVLEALCATPNANNRKGGLIGLAATAIALGKQCAPYTSRLMEPVFDCFSDMDSRVRYFACEALYNVVKICRASSLERFTDLFDILWKLSADVDQNVRSGAELLDRLVKEIVIATPSFDLEHLMLLVRERIYTLHSANRRFIISWLHAVLCVPTFSIAEYIPEVVDGVFKCLEDPAPAVREATVGVLGELLHKLDSSKASSAGAAATRGEKAKPAAATADEDVNVTGIVNVLVPHANSSLPIQKELAIQWLNQICCYYGERILPNLSAFLIGILPSLGDISLRTPADELNTRLLKLVRPHSTIPMIDPVVEVLVTHLRNERPECRQATLKWIRHLHTTHPQAVFHHMERVFPLLLELLSDPADEVLMLDILLITDICGGGGNVGALGQALSKQHSAAALQQQQSQTPQAQSTLEGMRALNLSDDVGHELKALNPYLIKFNVSLLRMFKEDTRLVEERGTQILRQICLLLNPAEVYRSLALLLSSPPYSPAATANAQEGNTGGGGGAAQAGDELEFVGRMVAMLSRILLTSCELFHLRQALRQPEAGGPDCIDLFERLYRCWCHQPVCLLQLCLLAQHYQHAVEVVQRLSEVDVTVEVLTEIDRLVQLIESPILAYVRMDLLNAEHQRPLAAVFSALLMLLPQTEAFNTLHARLQAVPHLAVLESPSTKKSSDKGAKAPAKIKFKELLQHLDKTLQQRKVAMRVGHRSMLDSMAASAEQRIASATGKK